MRRLTLALPFVLLAALAGPAQAQQRDTTRVVLPNIAPREVEIRGQLEISLPSLRRQPLVGFNPPPRVPNIPADRRPFAETYSEAGLDLPASPLQKPQPPSVLTSAPPAEGDVEALGGRYYSRTVRAYLSLPVSPTTALLTSLNYAGSDGNRPIETRDGRVAFDALDGRAALAYTGDRIGGGVALDGFYESYALYGLRGLALGPSLRTDPTRDGGGLTASAHIRTIADTRVDGRLEVRGGVTQYESFVFDNNSPSLTERVFGGRGEVHAPVGTLGLWADAEGAAASLDDNRGDRSAVEAGAGLRIALGRTARLRVGGRFVGAFYDAPSAASGAGTAGEPVEIGYLAPDVRLEIWLGPGVELYARQQPAASLNALQEVFQENPYVFSLPSLLPSLRTVDAEGGLRIFAGPVQLTGRGGFQDYQQYLFFEAADEGESLVAGGFSALRYAEAEIFYAGGSISVVLPAGLHAEVGATYREGRLPEFDDADIPYFAPVVAEATLAYPFAGRRGLARLTGNLESSRYIDVTQTREIGTFVDLDAEVTYDVTRLVGLVFRLENIGSSDNQRWASYPISPLVFGGGARIRW